MDVDEGHISSDTYLVNTPFLEISILTTIDIAIERKKQR